MLKRPDSSPMTHFLSIRVTDKESLANLVLAQVPAVPRIGLSLCRR